MTPLTPTEISHRGTTPLSLLEWAQRSLPMIRQALQDHGICWLRGLPATEPDLAQRLMMLLVDGELMDEVFWSTPRSRVSGKTFTATEYPSPQEIPLHSEMSYLHRYPRLLCFHALRCADTGGQTTVADLDAVSAALGELTAEFANRGVRYARVFRDGVDIPLTTAFGTDDPAEIESRAQAHGMRLEPAGDGATRLVHEAEGALHDALTGQAIWFNQMHLWHPARLPASVRDDLVHLFGVDGLPRQAFFGDGTTIPDEAVHAAGAAFARHTQAIDWLAGDVVLVDNLRYAHGRRPFTGQRTVHVAMGLPYDGAWRDPFAATAHTSG